MPEQPRIGVESDGSVARRSLLAGALAAWVGASCHAGEPDPPRSDEDREVRAIEAIATTAGLQSFGTTRSPNFLGIGDASDTFRSLALQDCEAVATDYLDYYQARGFKVAMPAARLTVVILTDERSRGAFNANPRLRGIPTKGKQPLFVPGHYEPLTNRVVLSLLAQQSRQTRPLNLQLLAHEVTHQLTFNTGLLERRGDIPHSIGEGLAEYGEFRKANGRTAQGQLHRGNLFVLVLARRAGTPWYPVDQLLADDRPFVLNSFAQRRNIAYAQAWLLIDYLMRDRSRLEGFRAYLEAIRHRIDPEHRLDDAEKHLGNLDRLNQDLLTHFVNLNKAL